MCQTNDPFTSLIEHQKLGVVCFDGRLRIVDPNTTAADMLAIEGALHPKGDLEELFPELVGIQDRLKRIIDQHDAAYRLDNVNRRDGHGQIRCWNLLLLAGPEVGRGMLIIDDVTEKATAIQVVNQEHYDRYLFRQSIDFSTDNILYKERYRGRPLLDSAVHRHRFRSGRTAPDSLCPEPG